MRSYARISPRNEGADVTPSFIPGDFKMAGERLLTTKELADLLRVRPDTIKLWTRKGMIPARRLSYKVIRYELAAVLSALESRGVKHG